MFKVIDHYPNLTILHHIEPDGTLWGTSGRSILRKEEGSTWESLARFPPAYPRDLFGFSRPSSRAMRADKSNLFVNSGGRVLGIRAAKVYSLEGDHTLRQLFEIQGDSVLHGGICEDPFGWTYFGEYFMNPRRDPVRLWRVNSLHDHWEIGYEFPSGSVRHIHGVYHDPFQPGTLWICTGDQDGECFIFRSDDNLMTMEVFGDGSQLWRAVKLHFTQEHVCWITDSQVTQNFACRMNRESGVLEKGQPIGAPVWYGTQTIEGSYLAGTTVEPGPAVQRVSAALLRSEDGFHWIEVASFEKDAWRPMKLFKYGVINFPSGDMSLNSVYISGEGLQGFDGCSMKIELPPGESP